MSSTSTTLYCRISWPVSAYGQARFAEKGCSLHKKRNTAIGADKPTLRAILWHSASALQRLPREQPLPANCALMRNATGSLIRQYNVVDVLP